MTGNQLLLINPPFTNLEIHRLSFRAIKLRAWGNGPGVWAMVDWGPAKRLKGMGENQLKTSTNSRKQVQIDTKKHKKIKRDKNKSRN